MSFYIDTHTTSSKLEMNAGRVSGALLTQSGCHPVPGMTVGVISGMCRGKVHAYAVTVTGYGEPGPGSSDGKALWHPATPPHRHHARKARRSTGPHTDFPSGLQLAACPSRPRSPTRSLPSPGPVPPHSGCPWLGPGWRMGVLAQPVPALATGTVSASPLMAVLLPCSKLVPGSLPFILLAQASAWEAY